MMKLIDKVTRKYYKREVVEKEEPWTQPVLSANGVVGGNAFACVASSEYNSSLAAWLAFDGNAPITPFDYCWYSSAAAPQWIEWYNPNPLKITKIQIIGGNIGYSYTFGVPTAYQIQASSDNTNWSTIYNGTNSSALDNISIDISDNNAYKYWRMYITATNYDKPAVREITITATTLETTETITPGTSEDYDFYEDVSTISAVVNNNKLYAFDR